LEDGPSAKGYISTPKSDSGRTTATLVFVEDGSLAFKVHRDGSAVHVFEYPAED
jgi:hypothetical protein